MKKKVLIQTLVFVMISTIGFSQTNKFWSANNVSPLNIIKDKAISRQSFPNVFKLFNVNIEPLRQTLFSIVGNRSNLHSTIISLPNAAGEMEEFEVYEASNFETDLQSRFPEIRAFSGKGITDRSATLKLSISPQGIQTMVFRTEKENEFIEAYSKDHTVYAVFKSQRNKGLLPWTCSTPEEKLSSDLNTQVTNSGITARSGGDLKTMRLAQSCNGEYANYFGATSAAQVGLVLAAFNATLTRCNGVYEKDLALHLNLIANTTDVIYYNTATDPYSTTLSQWNLQLQQTLTSVIGSANYDIGHMFGASGGGGNAGCIGCICVDPATSSSLAKGSGITSPNDGIPQGDNFDIDYVAHEVGHQLGANHTFSHSLEGTGVNKEVGSGITIMGYAGITNQDVASHSIDIFHQASIAQIQTNLASKSCPITTNISANNVTPVVAAVSNYTIPISTPFALTGSATDANPGDVLTYCWEQNDNSTTSGNSSVASATKLTGPNWLTFYPTTSPIRLFPKLSTILAGLFVTPVNPGGDAIANIEALSSVSRTLNFRLTVRDNSPYSSTAPIKVGQTQFTDMAISVTNTSGPFGVSSPNTAVSWAALSSQTITWTVNNTTASPVSCANVNILLSTDGGNTWPITLLANTPNDGSAIATIPNNPTTTARVKVESVGNIFFDISNSNFTITGAAGPDFDFNNPAANNISCNGPTSSAITLGTISYSGYTVPINLSATGVPAGTSISFGTNPVIPGNNTIVTLNNTNSLSPGNYDITITGISGSLTHTRVISFIVLPGTVPVILTQPVSQSVCDGNNASFTVVASGNITNYQWQLSTDGGTVYNNISLANADTYTIAGATVALSNYMYRVIINGQCGSTTSSAGTLTVTVVPSVPVITPTSATVCTGDIQSLSAVATSNILFQFGTAANTNNTTGSTAYPAPYTAWYGGQRMQTLIRASELSAAGFSAGSNINNIQFPVISRGSAWGSTITSLQNFKVSIGNSGLSILSAFQTGLTEVVAAGNFTPIVGYNNTHNFSAPFIWNGSSNIIIETTFSNNITGTASTTVTQYNSSTTFQSTIVYRADGVSAATAAAATTVNYSYSARPDLKLNGTKIAAITWSPISDLYTDVSANTSYTGSPLPLVYAKPATAGTKVYTATASINGCSSSNTTTLTVNTCIVTLNLKAFLEGMYIGSSTMASTLYDLGMSGDPTASDNITVNLWSASNLSNPNPDFTTTALLHNNGLATVIFPGAVNGNSYYIAVKHRNHMETWSKNPVVFNNAITYDFSNALSKAYDDGFNPPMAIKAASIYAFYGGDVNQDGTVDASDMGDVDNDNSIFAFGYNDSDVSGDGATDATDLSIVDNNSQLFLFYSRPY